MAMRGRNNTLTTKTSACEPFAAMFLLLQGLRASALSPLLTWGHWWGWQCPVLAGMGLEPHGKAWDVLGEGGSTKALQGPTGFAFSQPCSEPHFQGDDGEDWPALKTKLGKIHVFPLQLLAWPNELIARDKT